MELIDIGANLTHESFANDRAEVIEAAVAANVVTMVVTGACFDSNAQARALAAGDDRLYATAGTHPHHAADYSEDTAAQIREFVGNDRRVVAVGEAGLDYFRDISPRPAQRRCFASQLEIAAELDAPIFMHCRDAHDDFIGQVRDYRDHISNMVVHCFTAGRRELFECLDLDLYVGITGWICDERRGQHLQELVPNIPAERLLIETDSPYLLPRDLRPRPKSRRNEPKHLRHIAEAIAAARGEPVERLAARTTANARRFFALDQAQA